MKLVALLHLMINLSLSVLNNIVSSACISVRVASGTGMYWSEKCTGKCT